MVQFAIPSQPAQAPPQYAFAQASPPPPRPYAAQGTSSAFSSSANPDEDWTKISDLAERRRIQNRIAQRNYRKKLKRRLEDLERRAGSPEDTEAQKPAVSPPTAKMAKKVTKPRQAQQDRPQQQQVQQQQQQQQQQQARETNNMVKPMSQMQFTPPMEHSDEFIFGTYDDRERSNTPPMFNYSSYPAPDEMMMPPYGTSQSYPTGGMVTTADTYPNYLTAPVHSTLPSMSHFADASMKRDYSTDAYFSYGFMPGMDMHAAYDHTNPQTPPLTHSFDHSANCSEAGYEYPTTPLSMPGSPGLIQHQSN